MLRQGEYLTRLAFERGASAEEVWCHAVNAELRGRRESMDVLAPGDILRLPPKRVVRSPLVAGQSNRYSADVPRIPITLVFQNGSAPAADAPYTLEGLGSHTTEGRTDANGGITLQVPISVAEFRVIFDEGRRVFPILIGHMDPADEQSGIWARLANLGYVSDLSASEEEDDERMEYAIRAFQRDSALTVTGMMDASTARALQEAHRS